MTGYIGGGLSGGTSPYGQLWKTTDAGLTWTELTIAAAHVIYGIVFTSAADGYVTDWNGEIFKTSNGGTSWSLLPSGTTSSRFGIDFASGTGISVGGSGIILRTTTAGVAWSGVTSSTSDAINDIRFGDADNGFIVGGNIAANTGLILSTTNAGASWTIFNPRTPRLYALDYGDVNTAYAVGLNGTILKYMGNVGINEQQQAVMINAYPNPATGSATIDLSTLSPHNAVTIELFDVSGKLVRTNTDITASRFTLEQNEPGEGMYFFNVTSSDKIIGTGKIVFGK
jgi:hypothetical protein